jgi:hypothetical protein
MGRWALLAALLAGCTLPPPGQQQPITPQQLVNLIAQITQQDLETTIQIANSVTPPDVESIQCATFLEGFVPGLAGTQHTFIPPTGVASTFETLRLGWIEANSGVGLTPAQNQALEMACGPLALNTEYLVATGAITVASGVGASNFIQMLLALGHSNLPLPVPSPAAVHSQFPAPAAAPAIPAAAPAPHPHRLAAREPSNAQIAAYGTMRLTAVAHDWLVP